MFEKIVQRIINRILGEYVQNFSSENLHIGIWSGQVIVRNVGLKKDILKKLNLPFNITYSRLGCLKMNIPWSSLSTSKIDVEIQGCQLLISQIPEQFWECKNAKIIEQRRKEIQKYCETIILDFAKKARQSAQNEADKQQGYFSNLVVKIIDNIQVVVQGIHLRFEDSVQNKFSFGVTLEQLKAQTVNKNGIPQFIDRTKKSYQNEPLRKKLIMLNLGIYWNEASQLSKSSQLNNNILTDIFKKGANIQNKMNYLIIMSFNSMLYLRQPGQQFEQPQINVAFQFNQLKVSITNLQLQQIVTLGERLQRFSNQVKLQNRKKLTELQKLANIELFTKLFPKYFQKTYSTKQSAQIDEILQKMQTTCFQQCIKNYLQQKQKAKLVQGKIEKSKGWISGPKQLTEQQQKQIQDFMIENFGKETKMVKRPEGFYYIRIDFVLKLLQLSIANKTDNDTKQGVRLAFQNINVRLSLREEGYMLKFIMDDIKLDLFKVSKNEQTEKMTVVKKNTIRGSKQIKQYVKVQVFGNPENKKYLNQQIIVKTQELLIQFHPRIIKIVKQFVNIKLSQQNSEAAYEVYGDIKQKASSVANQSLKKPFLKKSFISLDINISAISLLLLFNPLKTAGEIWALRLGATRIYSDSEIVKKMEFNYNQPMERYILMFENLSLAHFPSKTFYLDKLFVTQSKDKVFDNLIICFELQLFKNIHQSIPKIRGKTVLKCLDICLTSFNYQSLRKINQCFTIQAAIDKQKQQKQKAYLKQQVLKGAKKIGVLYEQSASVNKYIAVLNGPYLYFYKDKKDLDYYSYFYIKNCQITVIVNEATNTKKALEVRFKNAVNEVVLGFEKEQVMRQWISAIQQVAGHKVQEKEKEQPAKPLTLRQNPNKLNFEFILAVQEVKIASVLETGKTIKIEIRDLNSCIKIHEAKNTLQVSLKSLQVSDDIYEYKLGELKKLLYSTSIQGKQKLIQVKLNNLLSTHPEYKNVDVEIGIEFGKLIFHYKPDTVQELMNFYLPKPITVANQSKQRKNQQKKVSLNDQLINNKQMVQNRPQKSVQIFSLRLKIRIAEVSAMLINKNNRVMFAIVGLTGFQFHLEKSSWKTSIRGRLKQIWLGDYSCYPETIYKQKQYYRTVNYIIQSFNNQKQMVQFGVQMHQVALQSGKSLFVEALVRDLKISYIQQPVLRIISYLLQQVLPSLSSSSSSSQDLQTISNTRPQQSNMVLAIQLENILAIVGPRCHHSYSQYLQLNVSNIKVWNKSVVMPFIKDKKHGQEQVLVQRYNIKMEGIKIIQFIRDCQIRLTNDLNFNVVCNLIKNPFYYRKNFKERFDGGMRIQCQLSPFLMCINHEDYNFIMKCLYWSVTYDDNIEEYFFPIQPKKIEAQNSSPTKWPIYFSLNLPNIILCITENSLPISVLILKNMKYQLKLEQGELFMTFIMNNLYGTTISKQDEKTSIQRGMFNSFGYEKKHLTRDLQNIQSLTKAFSRNQKVLQKNQNVLEFQMKSLKKVGQSFIKIKVTEIKAAIQLKNLITLSKLALIQDHIQPPKPPLEKARDIQKIQKQHDDGFMQISIQVGNFLGCLSDKKLQNYIIMEGEVNLKLKLVSNLSEAAATRYSSMRQKNGKYMQSSTYQAKIKNYSLYFCNIKDLKTKRYLLQPFSSYFYLDKFYSKIRESIYLETEIDAQIRDSLIVECSVRDLIMVNKILQHNLKQLEEINKKYHNLKQENNSKAIIQPKHKNKSDLNEISMVNQSILIDKKSLQRNIKSKKIIKQKSKGNIKLPFLQIKIINDCGDNFMPVFSFTVMQFCVRYLDDQMKKLIGTTINMKLSFFNIRSACWEPVIESFQFVIEHDSSLTLNGNKQKILLGSSDNQQLKQLKFNISTQLITTLYDSFEMAKQEKKMLQIEEQVKKQSHEISPYTIENRTNYVFTILRQSKQKQQMTEIHPFFNGPVKIVDKLYFVYKNRKFQINMENFGYVSVPGLQDIHLEFKISKLNRIICFVDSIIIKNSTNSKFYCIRYNQKKEKVQQYKQILQGQVIAVKKEWMIQLSFNLKTFTPPTKISSLSSMNEIGAQSEKFKLLLNSRKTILEHLVIGIQAPFLIQNCLPKDIKLQFITGGKHVSTRQIQAQTYHEVFANQSLANLKFKIALQGFYWSNQFSLDYSLMEKQNVGKQARGNLLFINDRQQGGTTIRYIFEKLQKTRQYKLILFCPAFVLSELDEDINIYGIQLKDQKAKKIQTFVRLAGQSQFWKERQQKQDQNNHSIDKVTLIGAQVGSKLRICGKNCLVDFSEPFQISSIGVHQARVVIEREIGNRKVGMFAILGIDIQPKKMTINSNIITKQITVRYRHIICNMTETDIFIREQQSSQKSSFFAKKGEKKPLYFSIPYSGNEARKMIIRSNGTMQSLPIPIDSLGQMYFRLQSCLKKGNFDYFKLKVVQLKQYIFYEFTALKYEDLPYQLVVRSQKFKLYAPAHEKVLTWDSQPLYFINQIKQYEYKLCVLVALIETQQSEEVVIETDNLNFNKVLRFYNKKTKCNVICNIHIELNESKKKIIIEDVAAVQEQEEHELQSLHIKLEKVSFSFIQNHARIEKPYQSFYFYIYNFEMILLKSTLTTKIQTRLQFMQLDQDQPFNIPNPVIMTPCKFKQFAYEGSKKQRPKRLINALIELNNKYKQNLFINQISVEFNDLVIRISTYFIKLVMSLLKQFEGIFKTEDQFFITKQVNSWKQVVIPEQGRNTFIKFITIAPFTIQISSQIRLNELDVENILFFDTIINALGVVVSNIEDAPIYFDGIRLDNCIDTLDGIQHKVIQHYKSSIIRQLYKIFGALNIIGNPIGLFKNISTGIYAMKQKPAEGFVKGPLQFGKGLADGTSSLIAYSFGGAFSSVEKMTGTIASGLAVLTFDKQFQQARQKQKMYKPKHVLEGLAKGGKAVIHGFKDGLTGVITKPIQETRKGGAVGLLKGVAKGFTGLVVKPVSGIVDFASKTSQGLKNTALYLEDKPNQNRIRNPRIFYTNCGFIKQYNVIDSLLFALICKHEQKSYLKNPVFISAFQINNLQFLVVLKDEIVMLNTENEKIEWEIPLDTLQVWIQQNNIVRIKSEQHRQWPIKKVNAVVHFSDKIEAQSFIKTVSKLKINMSSDIVNESRIR